MRRSGPLRSDPEKVRAWRARSKPLASKPKARTGGERAIRSKVLRRDGRCLIADVDHRPCFGPLTPHHKRKESQGGAYSMENLVAACSFHNDEIEADADLAARCRFAGFVIRRGDPGWDRLG